MTVVQRCQIGLAVVAEVVGLVFVGFAAYFWIMYLFNFDSPQRHEYSIGIAAGLLYGFAGLLAATFLVIPVKRLLPRRVFLTMTVPALVVGSILLAGQFYAAAMYLLG